MKPENISKRTVGSYIGKVLQLFSEDKITVYAAQASFFVVISVVPFVSLLISIVSFFIPADISGLLEGYALSEEATNLVGSLLEDLYSAPKVSLISFSAVITLWSASKGISAIRTGIETVYGFELNRSIVFHRLKSLLLTIAFIVLIIATVALLLFGDFLGNLITVVNVRDLIDIWSTPFVFLFMCIMLIAIYAGAARRSSKVKSNILFHIPGAMFASLGWILFSYIYSLYIKYFPNASYIYGSLAAVCLIMLWLYFCMIIMLLGAEVNKWFSSWYIKHKFIC